MDSRGRKLFMISFTAACGHTKVPVYKRSQKKKRKTYVSYFVNDLSDKHATGKPKQWAFAKFSEAKDKAVEIARLIENRNPDLLSLTGSKREIHNAIEAVEPTGVRIDHACRLVADACAIIPAAEILDACRFWKAHRPDKPFVPKLVAEAKAEFMTLQAAKSESRRRTLGSYLKMFAEKFGGKLLHEVDPVELDEFVSSKKWKPKTFNEFLGGVSLLYKSAAFRNWVPRGCNPACDIKRRKLTDAAIHVFEPWEASKLLTALVVKAPELVPFMALWLFAGIRKFEISRMNWPQVHRGVETGWIEMAPSITKTGRGRSVPVQPNLRSWLTTYQKASGTVLPAHWLTATKSAEHRLSELQRFISRKTGVVWQSNAPRHSYATYYFKITKDPGTVVAAMGTSLAKFERHYWNKTKTITEAVAKAWFDILPPAPANVIAMPPPNVPEQEVDSAASSVK